MSWQDAVDRITATRKAAQAMGGADGIARQHDKGRKTIRERIAALIDDGSFREVGRMGGGRILDDNGNQVGFSPANFVLGNATVDARPVVIGGEDFTLQGGSPNVAGLRKSIYAEDLAIERRVPLVRLHEGGGGSVAGSGGKGSAPPPPSPVYDRHRFTSMGVAMKTVPVISAALGPVAGLPAARLAAAHFTVMARDVAQIMVAGPAVVERALGKTVTKEELGGAGVHEKSGVVDAVAQNEDAALALVRQFLSFLPTNADQLAPVGPATDPVDRADDALVSLVPRDRRQPYDIRKLLRLVLDDGIFFEMGRRFGPGIVVGLGRLGGRTVAIQANDCRFNAGSMTAAGAQKWVRFLKMAETFHLPVVSFVDEPGFMIGPQAEAEGTVRHGADAVLATAMTDLPWCSVMIRKSFGVAAAAHYGPNAHVLAWPSAERGPLPLEGGVAVAFRREIAAAPDPAARQRELEDMMAARQSPFPWAEAMSIHDLIDPRETRALVTQWLLDIEHRLAARVARRT